MSQAPSSLWDLKPGDEIRRTELHERYGGRGQGGIGPSARSPNVFVFTDPEVGELHGYFDGWQADGLFHYTGEGQKGDQRMVSGNAAVLNHQAEGRALRLFDGARGVVTYVDEVVLDTELPWYETDAPETDGGPIRKVIVFRLKPTAISPGPLSPGPGPELSAAGVATVPVEAQNTEKTYVDPNREPYEAERREATLVLRLRDYLEARGNIVKRLKIVPPSEAKPLFTDLYDETLGLLVEAKGGITREMIRMAIGQLADYTRFCSPEKRAILVPESPRSDLHELARSQGIVLIWPTGNQFETSQGPL